VKLPRDKDTASGQRALQMCTASAEKGYTPAYWMLVKMHGEGYGIRKDSDMAFFWLKKGSLEGHGKAQDRLASIYEQHGQFEVAVTQMNFLRYHREYHTCNDAHSYDTVS
jgi:TPR repeat protein